MINIDTREKALSLAIQADNTGDPALIMALAKQFMEFLQPTTPERAPGIRDAATGRVRPDDGWLGA